MYLDNYECSPAGCTPVISFAPDSKGVSVGGDDMGDTDKGIGLRGADVGIDDKGDDIAGADRLRHYPHQGCGHSDGGGRCCRLARRRGCPRK
jgi:hypothetical protein